MKLTRESLETPCILIDENIVQRNIDHMADCAARNQVKLRPHIKTHKIPEFALKQLAQGAEGITVAKVGEAEIMAEHGIDDIFIAYPVVTPAKIKRIIALAHKKRMIVGVESIEGARNLSKEATAAGIILPVRLEIDTGLARTGAAPDKAVDLAQQIAALPGLDLSGIFTFKGAVFKGAGTLDLAAAGLEEGTIMVETAEKLRAAGIPIRDVSVGSTPTAPYAAAVEGVTEIRPGTYIFYDRMLAVMGACSEEDWAAKVLVTVVSVPAADRLVVDGGSKTFATDVQPGQHPLHLKGFGEIIGHPDAVFEKMNEEHGMIRTSGPHGLHVGDVLEIVPNHICPTVNLHNEVYVSTAGVIRAVPVLARGKLA
ncbi:amino acid aldolase [Paenibacillus donghaensis]|uniref:alanine racemase n=1 Tax=Paenibacillus donghaensis TaxID=414771 RepID=UPI0018846AE2|nr:alanine racemase [Paenibacillus donghaensis]MBE9917848.1 amino acid aldolase [Paenibacillus donghaensis]